MPQIPNVKDRLLKNKNLSWIVFGVGNSKTFSPFYSCCFDQLNDILRWNQACIYCLDRTNDLRHCSKCKEAFYCSLNCQKKTLEHAQTFFVFLCYKEK